MRLAFFGSPADAVPYLDALHDAGHEIPIVVSQPDRRRRRGVGSDPTPLKRAAQARGLTVVTPDRAIEVAPDLQAADVDLAVVVAFGQLLPAALLAVRPDRFVNVHYSLLPRWRGAAPVERAILAGDTETGVSLMRIEEGLDTGAVFATMATELDPTTTAGELRAHLTELGTELLVRELPHLLDRAPSPQHGPASVATKLTTTEFHLDPTRPAEELSRRVRAANPRPGAWLEVDGTRLKVWGATIDPDPTSDPIGTLGERATLTTADGTLVLTSVQPAGGRAMTGREWILGHRGPRNLR